MRHDPHKAPGRPQRAGRFSGGAIVCPAAIGALVAAPLVSLGGYPTLFAGTAIVAVLGSILVWRIKNVP